MELAKTGQMDTGLLYLSRAESLCDASDSALAQILSNKGHVLSSVRRFDEALECHHRASAIHALRECSGEAVLPLAKSLNDEGITRLLAREFGKALQLFYAAEKIFVDGGLQHSLPFAELLGNMGTCLSSLGGVEAALPLFLRSLAIRKDLLPPGHRILGIAYRCLAMAHSDLKN